MTDRDGRHQRGYTGRRHDRQDPDDQDLSGQLYVALTSSAETSWRKYKIKDPPRFEKGDYLISRFCNSKNGLHKGYVLQQASFNEGWFHPDQVQKVDDSSSTASPGDKRKAIFRSSKLPPSLDLSSSSLGGSWSNNFRGSDDRGELGRAKRMKTVPTESIMQRWVPPEAQKQLEVQEAQKKEKAKSQEKPSKKLSEERSEASGEETEPLASSTAGEAEKGTGAAAATGVAGRMRRRRWDSEPSDDIDTNSPAESCPSTGTETFQQKTPNMTSSTVCDVPLCCGMSITRRVSNRILASAR